MIGTRIFGVPGTENTGSVLANKVTRQAHPASPQSSPFLCVPVLALSNRCSLQTTEEATPVASDLGTVLAQGRMGSSRPAGKAGIDRGTPQGPSSRRQDDLTVGLSGSWPPLPPPEGRQLALASECSPFLEGNRARHGREGDE